MRFVAVLISLLLASTCVYAQLNPAERQGLRDSLSILNLSEADLTVALPDYPSAFRLPLVQAALEHSLAVSDDLLVLHSKAESTFPNILKSGIEATFGERLTGPKDIAPLELPNVSLPEELRPVVARLAAAIADANAVVAHATSQLSPAQKRLLIEGMPQMALQSEAVTFDFVRGKPVPNADLLQLLTKVDLAAIRQGAFVLSRRIEEEIPRLRKISRTVAMRGSVRFVTHGVVVEISGQEDDVHTSRDTNLAIDLGGNDTYNGRYGAGVGYASVLIDCGGNDTYNLPDLSLGTGVLGIGLAYDLGGKDRFKGKSLCFGCGIAGVGALFKDGGDDHYSMNSLGEGFGFFGCGLLLDTSGDDLYEINAWGQGAARTQGLGWLVDQSGDDIYRAKGLESDSALFPDILGSYAQGCGRGIETEVALLPGGVGLLSDLKGNDVYIAAAAAQGEARWEGLGSLYDAQGSDSYLASRLAQASADDHSAAFLFDEAGDDTYGLKFGSGQGFAQTSSVAFLLDRAGNDLFAGGENSVARSDSGSIALLMDAGGNDRYLGEPARSTEYGLSLLTDLGGEDHYQGSLRDGHASVGTRDSVVYDALGNREESDDIRRTKPGSLPIGTDEEMTRLLQRAVQGRQSEPARKLHGMGVPALHWLIAHYFDQASPATLRIIGSLVAACGEPGKTELLKAPITQDRAQNNLITLIGRLRLAEGADLVVNGLGKDSTHTASAIAAGKLKLAVAVPQLLQLAPSPDQSVQRAAMIALSEINNESSAGTAAALLKSEDRITRRAAEDLIVNFPSPALRAATSLLADPEERRQREGIALLGRMGNDESLEKVGTYLSSTRAGLRLQAVLALNGKVPASLRSKVSELRNDPDQLVRAVAARVVFDH